MEVKAIVQSYDWGVTIVVDEQCVCGCGMESHPGWMFVEVTEEISTGVEPKGSEGMQGWNLGFPV